MTRRRAVCLGLILVMLLLTACVEQETPTEPVAKFYTYGLDPQVIPLQITEDLFPDPAYGSMLRRIGLAGQDLTGHDFSLVRAEFLAGVSFDTRTRWPDGAHLPAGFDPEGWLQQGRSPGLGVDYLHAQGYDGRGWAVAIVGGSVLRDHEEFSLDVRFYPEVFSASTDNDMEFQGMVTSSILNGQTCGVAPAARLHYFSVPSAGKDFIHYGQVLETIRDMNQSLPAGEQIRIVVIADGLSPEDEDWQDWEEQLRAAEADGLYVLYANNAAEKGFFWGGCPPYQNRNQAAGYQPAGILRGGAIEEEGVLVPGDFRTTALHTGPDVYMYWADGGFSWAVPYLAGLCLLGWQAAPEMTLDQMMDVMRETADLTDFEWRVLNPVRFIFELERLQSG